MIGRVVRPDLREECILNQTGMVLNYAKYAPETTPPSWRRRTSYFPTRQNSCTVHNAERMNTEEVEDGNNTAYYTADQDILEQF